MSENVGTILDIVGKMSEFVCKMLKIIEKCSQILEIYFTQKLGRKVSLKLTTTFFDFSDFRKHVNSIKKIVEYCQKLLQNGGFWCSKCQKCHGEVYGNFLITVRYIPT